MAPPPPVIYACPQNTAPRSAPVVHMVSYFYHVEIARDVARSGRPRHLDRTLAAFEAVGAKWLAADVLECAAARLRRLAEGNIVAVQAAKGTILEDTCAASTAGVACVVVNGRLLLELSDEDYRAAERSVLGALRERMAGGYAHDPDLPPEVLGTVLVTKAADYTPTPDVSAAETAPTGRVAGPAGVIASLVLSFLGVAGLITAILTIGPRTNVGTATVGRGRRRIVGSGRTAHRGEGMRRRKRRRNKKDRLDSIKPRTGLQKEAYRDARGKTRLRSVFIHGLDSIPEEDEESSVCRSTRSLRSNRSIPSTRSLSVVTGTNDGENSPSLLGAIKLSASLSFRKAGSEERAREEVLGAAGSPFREKGWTPNLFMMEAVDGPFIPNGEAEEFRFTDETKGEEGEEEEFDPEWDGPRLSIT